MGPVAKPPKETPHGVGGEGRSSEKSQIISDVIIGRPLKGTVRLEDFTCEKEQNVSKR